jgi:predicted RNA-binding Zn ribbon-like protein
MSATPGHGQPGIEIGQAPGDLARLQAFINTLDIEQGTDELATPGALHTWLRREGLSGDADAWQADAPAGRPADSTRPAELALALALREALRAVLRSHVTHRSRRTVSSRTVSSRTVSSRTVSSRTGAAAASGDQDDAGAAERLAEIAAGLHARLTADASGAVRMVPGDSGTRTALARLLIIAAEAATLGTWERLKVCSADDCQWAFYDRSPTRSGCWCSMQVCGSRAKSRAYRSRRIASVLEP